MSNYEIKNKNYKEKFDKINTEGCRTISMGAEAVVYENIGNNDLFPTVIKKRISKTYRIAELDKNIRKTRTKKEVKFMTKIEELKNNQNLYINVPKIIRYDNSAIEMQKIDGITVKEAIYNFEKVNDISSIHKIIKTCGIFIHELHRNNIIHGDLTTMNFMIKETSLKDDINADSIKNNLFMLDFGLAQNTCKVEDKATDIFTFEKAIECVHKEEYTKYIYEGYVLDKETKNKLGEIIKRGRKK